MDFLKGRNVLPGFGPVVLLEPPQRSFPARNAHSVSVPIRDQEQQHERFARVWDNNLRLQGFAEAFEQQDIRLSLWHGS